jgi:hypothetical protein
LPEVNVAETLSENHICEQEVLYFSRVLSGQCHEMANALNIARELCGLHEDIFPRAREGHADAVEKLGSLAHRMQTQIDRCHAIVRTLGHFAHSADGTRLGCDVREIVERALFFAARQVRLRQAELQAVVPAGDVQLVECNPFLLQQAIHAGTELLLEGIGQSRRITVGLTPETAGAVVTLASADPFVCNDAAPALLAEITATVQAAGGELRETPESGGELKFFIPYCRRGLTSADSELGIPKGTGGGCDVS